MPLSREADAARQRERSAAQREVVIPPCVDRARRERLETDCEQWLRWYAGHVFTYELTLQQREMVGALVSAMSNGGDQAIAASRGEGKTTLCEWVLTWAILSGRVPFAVLFCATGSDAENCLATFKDNLAGDDAERLEEDYPEVVVPIKALENTPQRAHSQLVTGRRHDTGEEFHRRPSKFTWCGRKVTLPNVPGSPAAGAILTTRGLDGAVRGLKVGNRRPTVAVIDDPDTDDTVNSEEQAAKLERKIERNIAGLAGQRKRLARIMLTTIQRSHCVSARYTDAQLKPSWMGKRFRFLVKPPDRPELWAEYVERRRQEKTKFAAGESDDEHARGSHRLYVENRDAMDAGAVVANPNRFDDERLPDGTRREESALQRYYNLVADLGQEAVSTEYDNDPPPEEGPKESGITAYRVQHQVNGLPRRVIPPGCVLLTAGVDCRKIALHWVVRAWQIDGTGHTIDYGVHEVRGTMVGSDEGVDLALRRAILERLEDWKTNPYQRHDGGSELIRLVLVDAGWRTEAVYLACADWGGGVMPSMGFGRSNGCAKPNFSQHQQQSRDRRAGDGWFMSRRAAEGGKNLWLVGMDADRWKAWEHDRWMTEPGQVGSMQLYGAQAEGGRQSLDQKAHFSYAKHITSEIEAEEVVGGALKRSWRAKSDTNHWLDASYMANVAANICGVKLLRSIERAEARRVPTSPREEPARPLVGPQQRTGRVGSGVYVTTRTRW